MWRELRINDTKHCEEGCAEGIACKIPVKITSGKAGERGSSGGVSPLIWLWLWVKAAVVPLETEILLVFVSCREIFTFPNTGQRTNATNDDRIQVLLEVVVSKFLNKIITEPVKSDAN